MSDGLASRKILIVDDDAALRHVVSDVVAALGCTSDRMDASQALANIACEKYDAVILDLRSPFRAASEVVAHLQCCQASIMDRVIVITADVPDAKALALVERYFLLRIGDRRLGAELPTLLRVLLTLGLRTASA